MLEVVLNGGLSVLAGDGKIGLEDGFDRLYLMASTIRSARGGQVEICGHNLVVARLCDVIEINIRDGDLCSNLWRRRNQGNIEARAEIEMTLRRR